MLDRKDYRFLLAVIALACLVYLAAFLHGVFSPEIRLLPDSFEYLRAAENMRGHGVFYSGPLNREIDFSLYTRRPPGYPVLIMLLSMVLPSASLIAAFQAAMVFLGGYFLWEINRGIGIPARFNIIALAVYLLYPGQVIYSQMIMAETILQFFLLASVWFLLRFLKHESAIHIIGANLCLGAAVMCKPVMLYFWVPSLLLHLLLFKKHPKKIILAALFIPLAASSLWSLRNYQVTGVYHFSSLKSTHMRFSIPDAEEKTSNSSREDFSTDYRRTEKRALDILLDPERAGERIVKVARKTAGFFLDPGRFDIYRFIPVRGLEVSTRELIRRDEDWKRYFRALPVPVIIYLGVLLFLNLLIIMLFLPFPFLSRPDPFLRFFMVLLVLYNSMVVSLASLGTARYRLAVEPLLIMGAAAVAASAWRRFKNRKEAP